jgi:hypothetical protein
MRGAGVHMHNIGARGVHTEYWQSAEEICWCTCNVGMQCMHVEYSCHTTGLINGARMEYWCTVGAH